MERQIRIVGVKRKEIDEEKLALAFLLLAKTLHDQKKLDSEREAMTTNEAEAA